MCFFNVNRGVLWMDRAHHCTSKTAYIMYDKHTIQNCMYKWPSWWWTHDVRNMQKTSRSEFKH